MAAEKTHRVSIAGMLPNLWPGHCNNQNTAPGTVS